MNSIKNNEIFSFNIWIILNIFYAFYVLFALLPFDFKEYLINNFNIFIPDRYWFAAVPIHFFLTLFYIFCVIKGVNYYFTDDNVIDQDFYFKKLSENEMNKEISSDFDEIPDTGDLDKEIVNFILK